MGTGGEGVVAERLVEDAFGLAPWESDPERQDPLAELVKNRTTIVIAHRLSTIKHADNIIVLDGGRVIENGPLDQLLEARGKFYRLWQEQKFF